MDAIKRLAVAVLPLLASAGLLWLLGGPFSPHGSENDVLLGVPLAFMSLVFLASSLVCWRRGLNWLNATAYSAAVAFVAVLAMGVLFALLSW